MDTNSRILSLMVDFEIVVRSEASREQRRISRLAAEFGVQLLYQSTHRLSPISWALL